VSPRSATPTHPVLRQRKLVLTLALLLAGLGLVSWLTMVRQEDPRLPEFFGMVTVTFPGADAETMERLVLDPMEEELGRVEEIKEILGTANAEIAFLDMDLRDDVEDTDAAWERVRQALDVAARELPAGASKPFLDDRQQDAESIVYAVTGHPDPLVLGEAAGALEELLLAVPGVTDITVVSDPGEQITIELTAAEARRLGVTPAGLAAQLAARSRILPGGSVEVDGRSVRLRPQSEFSSLEEIRATPVMLPGGQTVPLAAVARVRRGPEEPARSRMRSDGRAAVGVGVVPKSGINLVDWGERVRQRMVGVEDELARLTGHPVEVEELIYQPARVEARLSNLNRSLLTGALVVALVLILTMGLRLGLVVAAVVPLVSLSAMAVYALGGGVLHQMSIAAVVIALGMLVDNAIVMAEAIQWRIDHGEAPEQATAAAVRELAVPLAGATATTLAAFVPMLLAGGVTAIFTRAIPVVIMITLAVSYLFAVYVTPALAAMTLKPRPERAGRGRLARRLGALAVGRPGSVLTAGLVVVLISFSLFPLVRQEFFPESDRNQLVVDLKLPEGSHLDATDRVARHLERELLPRPDVTSVISFIGRSAPHFYYNLSQIPWSPHFAQVVLETASLDDLDAVMARVRQVAAEELPEAEVVVRKLEQGPPVSAPVEVRLYGQDLASLHAGAERVMAQLRSVPGTADVRHDLSPGSPLLRFQVDDAAAGRHGLTRVEVANALYGATRGLPVGQYRAGDDPVPIVVRSQQGERYPLAELPSLDVSAPSAAGAGNAGAGSAGAGGGAPVPLAQVARLEAEWRPGAILHRNRRRTVSISSQLADGATYSDVTDRLVPRLAGLELPDGVELEMGGAAESSGDANSAMVRTGPAGVLLLLGILMAEFRSFRRVGIVLVTVPLAVAGIVPGLLLGDQPFGFMSLLGVLALAGVVVNNAIVLLEVVESRRREGAEIAQAVADAVERRVRPILLTTATTVLGLLPLAFSPSTLWPPLAWTMISGLIASTLLTLLVVPALYMLLFRPRRVWPGSWQWRRVAEATVVVLALISTAGPAAASPHPPVQQGEWIVSLPRSAGGSEHLASGVFVPQGPGADYLLSPAGTYPHPPDQQREGMVSPYRSAGGNERLASCCFFPEGPGANYLLSPDAASPHPPDQQGEGQVSPYRSAGGNEHLASGFFFAGPSGVAWFPGGELSGEEAGGVPGVGSSGGADRQARSEVEGDPEPRTTQPRPRPVVHRKRGGPTPGTPPASVLSTFVPPDSPVRLTLPEAMTRAASRPSAAAARHRATAATHAARAEARAGRLPTIEVGGQLLQRDRDLELETPIGSFSFGDRRTEVAQLTVVQPLFVPQRQLYAAPAARADARAAGLAARRASQRAALTASEAFLDVLAIDAALASTAALLASLDVRLSEAEARAEAGRALESDALKVRLARESARQDQRALATRRRVALMELARAVGEPGSVVPVWPERADATTSAPDTAPPRDTAPPESIVPAPPPFPEARARAFVQRPDLAALRAGLEAAELRHGEVRAELLPSLRATAGYTHQGGSPYREDGWVEGGLVLSWRPLAAGTRAARAAARAEEATALAAELVEARRGIELELGAAFGDLDTAEGALEVGKSGVRQARETLRVERERHAAGRVTTNDLLAAEAALHRERTRRDVAALDVVRARVRVWTAMGRSPF